MNARRASFLTLCLVVVASSALAVDRPNVLFIAVDDLNDWIGCLGGHPQASTPNMDRLAARGTLFASAHCAAPACNPSRAAVWSGLMPNTTRVWSNDSGGIQKVYPDAKHLPRALREAGYHTAGTGKLYHGQGPAVFDQYQAQSQRWSPFSKDAVNYTDAELPSKGTANPRHVLADSRGRQVVLPRNRMPSDRNPHNKKGESFDWGGFELPDEDWGDTRCANWAIARIKEPHDKPLFLGVGFYRPHIPLFAPQRFFDRFKHSPGQLPPYREDDLADLSPLGKQWALEAVTAGLHRTVVAHQQWQAAVEAYLACVSYVDHEVGRLLDALDRSPLADNTLIVLWSDHGWQLGEKQHWGKWTGWERSTRVPLIVVPPKQQAKRFARPGSVCHTPVGLIDLYPTLVEMCGLTGPPVLDGDSLVPLLEKPKALYRETTLTMFDKGNASVRDARYRYLRYVDGSEELYDLQEDPHEWKNLANARLDGDAKHSKTLQRLRQSLSQHLARFQAGTPRISASQLKWVGSYRNQPNLPRAGEMLVHQDAEPELDAGFSDLIRGDGLEGWVVRQGACRFERQGRQIIGTCVPGSPSTYLCTARQDYRDFVFTAELKHAVDGNTGVMFRAARKPGEGKYAGEMIYGPQCEVEAYSKQRLWSGGIYGQSAGGWIYPMWLTSHAPARRAMKPQGQWNRITIEARGARVKTWLNGKPAAHWKSDAYSEGFFGLQIHAGKTGEIHFRNIKVKEL